MKVALTNEERQALLRLINDALESPRFPAEKRRPP